MDDEARHTSTAPGPSVRTDRDDVPGPGLSRPDIRQDDAGADDDAMTRSEQRLVAGTEVYESGRARLRKYVVTEDVQITVQVRREELRIEREPIASGEQMLVEDPDVFGAPDEFGGPDGGIIFEVTLHEERPVISTEIVAVERVRLSKLVQTEQHVASGQIRKERIDVEVPGRKPTTFG